MFGLSRFTSCIIWGAFAVGAAAPVAAETVAAVPAISGGDTAFVATCALFVMVMMLPGLALFYAGLARTKNVLSLITQVFTIAAMICVLWTVAGYSLTFDSSGAWPSIIGGIDKLFMANVTTETMVGTIPEYLYYMFMMLFAAITPPIMIGAFAERMRFSAVLLFMALWFFLNYVPMAHMAWGGGWVFNLGVQDFAGGNVVHLNAGVSALVVALMVGPRHGLGMPAMAPHNMTMTASGGSLLWVGWLAFCGGCALVANGFAMLVMVNTLLGGAAGALSWMVSESLHRRRASTLGILSGCIAGLVAVTPACGFVGPMGAIAIGFAASPACIWAVEWLKPKFGYDDSFDVFGVHGVGAIVGGTLTPVFAIPALGGAGFVEGRDLASQMVVQIGIILFSSVYAGIATFLALRITALVVSLRVPVEHEQAGLDISAHGESGYHFQ